MDEIMEGIKRAIEDERKAQGEYKKLRDQTDDHQAKQFFQQLIEDEKKHERLLLSRYEALQRIARRNNED